MVHIIMKKDLVNIEGTVAYVLNKNMHRINFNGTLNQAKASLVQILQSPEIKQQDLAKKYMIEIQRMKSMSHFLSTITTYLTGEKVYRTNVRKGA